MKEVWKPVVGFEGVAEVSNLGRVRSLDRVVKSRNGVVSGRIKSQRVSNSGYNQVGLYIDGKQYQLLVHRLVAKAFIDNPDNLPEVNHIDENRLNNSESNLEWVTRSGNARHSIKKFRGSLAGGAKLNEKDVIVIKQLLREGNLSQVAIASRFGVTNHTIHKIKAGVNWAWLNSHSDLEEVKP